MLPNRDYVVRHGARGGTKAREDEIYLPTVWYCRFIGVSKKILLTKQLQMHVWIIELQLIECAKEHYTNNLAVKADCWEIIIVHNLILSNFMPLPCLQIDLLFVFALPLFVIPTNHYCICTCVLSLWPRNVVHASDSLDGARREIQLWFNCKELTDWDCHDQSSTFYLWERIGREPRATTVPILPYRHRYYLYARVWAAKPVRAVPKLCLQPRPITAFQNLTGSGPVCPCSSETWLRGNHNVILLRF